MNRATKVILTLVVVGGFALGTTYTQTSNATSLSVDSINQQHTHAHSGPVLREYRGIKLQMKRDEVQAALGKPENSSDASDDFKLNGDDTMTVHYDNGVVKAIQLAFLDAKNAPAWKDVVGDAEVEDMANGAKAARKTVAAEKFWVSIYQNKDASITRITISRMN
ncbi:MAG: hypothetical protein U0X75_02930 [Acidobacteriota bacterium]